LGTSTRQEYSVIRDAVNLAARLEDASERGQIFVGPETYRLTRALFTFERLAPLHVKGKAEPVQVYRVLGASDVQSLPKMAGTKGLTSLVGRECDVLLLRNRWEQAKGGQGQVVLVNGEMGIGKSRMVEVLREYVKRESATWLTFRCSPYYTHSALYPVITRLHQVLHFCQDEPASARLEKLESLIQVTCLPLAETAPLMAHLLSVPLAERYPPLPLSPQQQRQKTHQALVAWLIAEAERQPVLAVWEDLHWADPSTLELLGLLLDQTPTAPLCTLLTCRLEFAPQWAPRSYLTQLTLSHLTRPHVEELCSGSRAASHCPPRWCGRLWPKPTGYRCMSRK
jgi:hypothetical protein